MKVMIDVPDRYVDSCKGLVSLMADDDDETKELTESFDSLKGTEVELDLSMMSKEKAKELSIGLLMVIIAQNENKKDGV